MGQEWLTRAQAAERLGVGGTVVRDLCAKGLLEERRNEPPPPPGLCGCGCGQRTLIARETDARWGYVKGQPRRFAHGHNTRHRVSAASLKRLQALRAARAAVNAAQHQLAVAAATGDTADVRNATLALAGRKADLLLLELEVTGG